jgi:hypothetical protein
MNKLSTTELRVIRNSRRNMPSKRSIGHVKDRLWFIRNSDMRPFYDRSYNGPPINPELKEDLS